MSSENWIFRCSEEFDNIEDRVELTHGVGQAEACFIKRGLHPHWPFLLAMVRRSVRIPCMGVGLCLAQTGCVGSPSGRGCCKRTRRGVGVHSSHPVVCL
jgi:hypothetical protein